MISYTYDEFGRTVGRSINGSVNSLSVSYDSLGRVNSEANKLSAFSYGFAGISPRVTSVTTPEHLNVNYDYWPQVAQSAGDGDHRLKSVQYYYRDIALNDIMTKDFNYRYSPSGNVTRWAEGLEGQPNVSVSEFEYDRADQLIGVNQETGSHERSWWNYDAAGNRKVDQRSSGNFGSLNGTVNTGTYNAVNQLTYQGSNGGEMEIEGTVNKPVTLNMTANWGLIQDPNACSFGPSAFFRRLDGLYGFRAKIPIAGEMNFLTITATDAAGNTAFLSTLLSSNTDTSWDSFTYDEAGNMTSKDQTDSTAGDCAFTWDAANRLVQIDYPGNGNKTEFTYDGMGRRVRIKEYSSGQVEADHRFLWEGMRIAERRSGDGTLERRYFGQGWVGGTSASPTAAQKNFYRRDHLGSVREVVNGASDLVLRQSFSVWGVRTVDDYFADTDASDFGFTGHYFHTRTGLYLAPYRAYSPEFGRWLSRDPIGEADGLNLYAYVKNNPVSAIDPSGLCGCTEFRVGVPPDRATGFYDGGPNPLGLGPAIGLITVWGRKGIHELIDKLINKEEKAVRTAANLYWDKPCGTGKIRTATKSDSHSPTDGSQTRNDGTNAAMVVKFRYSRNHTFAEANAASAVDFVCDCP